LAPQHATVCDPEITTKEDFDYWKRITEESNLEVTDGFTASRTKLKTKQRLKALTLWNIVMRTYLMYCEYVLCTFIVSQLLESVI